MSTITSEVETTITEFSDEGLTRVEVVTLLRDKFSTSQLSAAVSHLFSSKAIELRDGRYYASPSTDQRSRKCKNVKPGITRNRPPGYKRDAKTEPEQLTLPTVEVMQVESADGIRDATPEEIAMWGDAEAHDMPMTQATLLDHFAGLAFAQLINNRDCDAPAEEAYQHARRMLQARANTMAKPLFPAPLTDSEHQASRTLRLWRLERMEENNQKGKH